MDYRIALKTVLVAVMIHVTIQNLRIDTQVAHT